MKRRTNVENKSEFWSQCGLNVKIDYIQMSSTKSEWYRNNTNWDDMDEDEQEEFENFLSWIDDVDEIVQDRTGYSLMNCEDCTFRDWYEEGCDASDAADNVIDDMKRTYGNGWPFN